MSRAFERTKAWTNSGTVRRANGHAHAFQFRYIDDTEVGFDTEVGKIQVVEFTETRWRGVVSDVPEHEFASAVLGDPWDVDLTLY